MACKGRGRGKRTERTSSGVGEEGGGGGGVLMPGACEEYGCVCELVYTNLRVLPQFKGDKIKPGDVILL